MSLTQGPASKLSSLTYTCMELGLLAIEAGESQRVEIEP